MNDAAPNMGLNCKDSDSYLIFIFQYSTLSEQYYAWPNKPGSIPQVT